MRVWWYLVEMVVTRAMFPGNMLGYVTNLTTIDANIGQAARHAQLSVGTIIEFPNLNADLQLTNSRQK